MVGAQRDSYWHAVAPFWGAPDYPSQPDRAQHYATDQQSLYSGAGADGIGWNLGVSWWQWSDSTAAESYNEGVVSRKDNAYDGKCAAVAPSVDKYGYPCGGETANYGDFLSSVIQSNGGIVQQLISDLGAQ